MQHITSPYYPPPTAYRTSQDFPQPHHPNLPTPPFNAPQTEQSAVLLSYSTATLQLLAEVSPPLPVFATCQVDALFAPDATRVRKTRVVVRHRRCATPEFACLFSTDGLKPFQATAG